MNSYSKLRNNHEYQIELARAERVAQIASGMSRDNAMVHQYVEDTKKQWGPFDEMPQELLKELKELQGNLQLQDELLPVLDRRVGHMFIEAVSCFKMGTTFYR